MITTKHEALTALDSLFWNQPSDAGLNDLQEKVFCYCWEGLSYQAIAEQLGYDTDYIRRVGSQIWKRLSVLMERPVRKNNFQSAFRRYTSSGGKRAHLSSRFSDHNDSDVMDDQVA